MIVLPSIGETPCTHAFFWLNQSLRFLDTATPKGQSHVFSQWMISIDVDHTRPLMFIPVVKTLVPLVNIKIAGKWMFIPLKMVLIGIDPYPYLHWWVIKLYSVYYTLIYGLYGMWLTRGAIFRSSNWGLAIYDAWDEPCGPPFVLSLCWWSTIINHR